MHVYAAQAAAVPAHFGAISMSAAAVLLTLAALLKWRPLRRAEFLIPWLCLLAGIGLAAAFLRGWANWLTSFGTSSIPIVGVAVPWIIAIFLLYVVCYDLWPKHPTNNLTAVSALLLPSFGPGLGGATGMALGTVMSSMAAAGATGLATLFGV